MINVFSCMKMHHFADMVADVWIINCMFKHIVIEYSNNGDEEESDDDDDDNSSTCGSK